MVRLGYASSVLLLNLQLATNEEKKEERFKFKTRLFFAESISEFFSFFTGLLRQARYQRFQCSLLLRSEAA